MIWKMALSNGSFRCSVMVSLPFVASGIRCLPTVSFASSALLQVKLAIHLAWIVKYLSGPSAGSGNDLDDIAVLVASLLGKSLAASAAFCSCLLPCRGSVLALLGH